MTSHISSALDTIQSTPLLQRTLEELCEQEEGLLVGMLIMDAYRKAKRGEAVRYGCHCDIEAMDPGFEPDACVFDIGDLDDCTFASRYKRKEDCPHWKPVKGGANGR